MHKCTSDLEVNSVRGGCVCVCVCMYKCMSDLEVKTVNYYES